jgi:hypothetical protein
VSRKKSDKRTSLEKAIDAFGQALAKAKEETALKVVEAHFAKFPEEKLDHFKIRLRHFEKFNNSHFLNLIGVRALLGRCKAPLPQPASSCGAKQGD